MAKGTTASSGQERLATAVRCLGETANGERCKRKTRNVDENCRQCKGKKEREARKRNREAQQKQVRKKAAPLDEGTLFLFGLNLNNVLLRLHGEENNSIDNAIRKIYPKLVGVRSLEGAEFVGPNRLWLATHATLNNFESPEWGTPSQWKRQGGKVSKTPNGAQVIVHGRADGQWVPQVVTLYNRDEVEFKKKTEPVSFVPPQNDPKKAFREVASTLHQQLGIEVVSGPEAEPRPGVLYPEGARSITIDDAALARTDSDQIHQLLHETVHLMRSRLRQPEEGNLNETEEELVAVLGTAELAARLRIPLDGDLGKDHAYLRKRWNQEIQGDDGPVPQSQKVLRALSLSAAVVNHLVEAGVVPEKGHQ